MEGYSFIGSVLKQLTELDYTLSVNPLAQEGEWLL